MMGNMCTSGPARKSPSTTSLVRAQRTRADERQPDAPHQFLSAVRAPFLMGWPPYTQGKYPFSSPPAPDSGRTPAAPLFQMWNKKFSWVFLMQAGFCDRSMRRDVPCAKHQPQFYRERRDRNYEIWIRQLARVRTP